MDNLENTKDFLKVSNKRNFYTIKDSGLVYLLAIVVPLLVSFVFLYISLFALAQIGVNVEEVDFEQIFENYLWFSIPYLLITHVCFICIWLSYHPACKISYSASSASFKKLNPWTAILSALVGIVCVLGFVWLIEGCFGSFFEWVGFETVSYSLPMTNIGWLILNLIILGVVPAICEELLFRGMIFNGLKEKFSPKASILLCGLLFALLHGSVTQFIYPFILGCLLSFVMEKTGNLLYPILIHMFNNFTTIVLNYIVVNSSTGTISFPVEWWGWICAILVAVATVALLWLVYWFYLRKQKKLEIEKQGQSNQTQQTMVGKFPLILIFGMVLAVILIIISAI